MSGFHVTRQRAYLPARPLRRSAAGRGVRPRWRCKRKALIGQLVIFTCRDVLIADLRAPQVHSRGRLRLGEQPAEDRKRKLLDLQCRQIGRRHKRRIGAQIIGLGHATISITIDSLLAAIPAMQEEWRC